jgi:hypothetical protein
MNCPFCDNLAILTESIGGPGQYGWHDCPTCQVSLLTHQSTDRIVSHMYHRQIKDKYYVILTDHTVKLLHVGSPTLQEHHTLIKCEYSIDSITPTNVIQKLQTILLFL